MIMEDYLHVFIPSYHRARNLRTVDWLTEGGYPVEKIHVVIDDEADDSAEYEEQSSRRGFVLHVFSQEEARRRYDYVHRPSRSRRSAGQARNMFQDIAKGLGIERYVVMDDDTTGFEFRPFGRYGRLMSVREVAGVFSAVMGVVKKWHVGLFGLSQTGEMFETGSTKLLRNKIMNCTFVNLPFVYRGERGVQDDDTSQYVTAENEGYFVASLRHGCVLKQMPSATQPGGLTDLYHECKLLNKALVTVIQFPSAIRAERQVMNGGRLHHRINARYLAPKVLKGDGTRGNIEWDTYPEDVPFTNEPKRGFSVDGGQQEQENKI